MNSGLLGRVAVVSILISASAYAANIQSTSIVRLSPQVIASSPVARIVSITPTKIQVKGANGLILEAAPAANINNGQAVWIIGSKRLANIAAAPPRTSRTISSAATPPVPFGYCCLAFVQFPIEQSRSDNVAVGHMQSDVKVSNTGILKVTTRTWTNNASQGFEGGVIVSLEDKDGNDLYVSTIHAYGVNGVYVPGAPSDRTVVWTDNVPLDKINNTAKVAIVQLNAPTNKIDDFLAHAKQVADIAKTLSEAYKNISGGPGGPGGPGGGGVPTTTTPP
jgi:hypothetical protein